LSYVFVVFVAFLFLHFPTGLAVVDGVTGMISDLKIAIAD